MAKKPTAPVRLEVLEKAAELTGSVRNASYGEPAANMACFAAYMDVYRSFSARRAGEAPTPAHDAAMMMVLAKIARITIGAKGHRDNYIDGAAYLAIAIEADE